MNSPGPRKYLWYVAFLVLLANLSSCKNDTNSHGKPAVHSSEEHQPTSETEPASQLTPPSLSVFEAASMWQAFGGADKLTVSEVAAIPDQLSALAAQRKPSETAGPTESDVNPDRDVRYMFIPMLLCGAKHLFREEPPWSEEETDLAVKLAGLLADMLDQPEFRIAQRDDASVRRSLVQIKDWFEKACEDDQVAASMIFTFDDGPFFGELLDDAEAAPLTEIARAAVKETGGWLIVGKDNSAKKSLVMQYCDSAERPQWSRRITAGSEEVGAPISFSDSPVEYHRGFGFKVNMYATWTYGTERMSVYLDENGDFRFFFLSW